jgi:3-deoxy-D-manno-octulosonate 8-phosphate phosphatase (KDO 8-P phosphatase)
VEKLSAGDRDLMTEDRFNDLSKFRKKLKKIRCLLLDVDGVLTDGSIILGAGGMEMKRFHVQDGMGITLARMAGIRVGIITGRKSEAVTRRAEELGIDYCFQEVKDKCDALDRIVEKDGFREKEICYIGDDIQDILIMERAGISVAVSNARDEVKSVADYTTAAHGGRGAVREVVEEILIAQNKWEMVLNQFGLTTR